jgi:hypothetical protein
MPRPKKTIENNELLEAALAGLQLKRQQLDEQIREVRALLGGVGRRAHASAAPKNGSSRLSPAARKRIAAAQKRRWAEYRKSASKAE